MGDADQGAANREIVGDQQATRVRLGALRGCLAVLDEGNLTRTGLLQGRRACDLKIAGSFECRIQIPRDFIDPHHSCSPQPVSYKLMPVDPSASVAFTARVHPQARIGPRVKIGEFRDVKEDVAIGAECRIEPYVYVKRWTTLGERNEISAGTVLGTDPLDKHFTGERSYLRIGSGNIIREHYTISRGTQPESATEIGDGNYIMTAGHIAHNCRVGNNTVIASCALVAGHVEVGDQAFISGGVVIHQYSKIGRLAMIGGNSRVNLDVPPFFLYTDFNVRPNGLNMVGLEVSGAFAEEIAALKAAYKILYRSHLKLKDALARIASEQDTETHTATGEVYRSSERGICRE